MGQRNLLTILTANIQSGCLARRVASGTADSCVITELGKCVVSKSFKVSPSDCVHLPDGATKNPSLIFGFLDRALYSLAEQGRSLMELQKVLQAFLEAFLTTFL